MDLQRHSTSSIVASSCACSNANAHRHVKTVTVELVPATRMTCEKQRQGIQREQRVAYRPRNTTAGTMTAEPRRSVPCRRTSAPRCAACACHRACSRRAEGSTTNTAHSELRPRSHSESEKRDRAHASKATPTQQLQARCDIQHKHVSQTTHTHTHKLAAGRATANHAYGTVGSTQARKR